MSSSTNLASGSTTVVFTLVSIDAVVLPATLQESPQSPVETVLASTLVTTPGIPFLGSGSGTFTEVVIATVLGAPTTYTERGTWVANGGSVTFDDQTNSQVYPGSISANNMLTRIQNGFAELFLR